MPEFRIIWEGTVSGETYVEADTIEEAIEKAKHSDDPIDIEYYPEDWAVDEETTEALARDDYPLKISP